MPQAVMQGGVHGNRTVLRDHPDSAEGTKGAGRRTQIILTLLASAVSVWLSGYWLCAAQQTLGPLGAHALMQSQVKTPDLRSALKAGVGMQGMRRNEL